MEERACKLILIIGYNGTGKTTTLKTLVLNELKKKESHILIVTPDDIEWNKIPEVHHNYPSRIENYKGARKIIFNEAFEFADKKTRTLKKGNTVDLAADYFRNGLLIFDDCRAYFKNATLDSSLHNLLIRRRQKMIDIIMVAHGFTEMPPKAFTFASEIILFKTMDNIERRKNVLKDFIKMQQAQLYVNKQAETNPHFNIVIPQI